jgi:hypothetical protein
MTQCLFTTPAHTKKRNNAQQRQEYKGSTRQKTRKEVKEDTFEQATPHLA